jgi:acyl transferase domain-containing protein/acyl carrier protein
MTLRQKTQLVALSEQTATTVQRPVKTIEPAAHTQMRPASRARAREQEISSWLCGYLERTLERGPDAIDPHEPLARYGVDSLAAAEMVGALEEWLGRSLPATLSYDNPTVASLARALAGSEAEAPPLSEFPRHTRAPLPEATTIDPIAIVGMACRFPGAADLASFWHLLRHGVDAITEVPSDRWDVEALYAPAPGTPGKMCSKWGGFVAGIDQFDAAFFGISAREAARIDPQQRMFLEVAWEALEDAGQSPAALAGSRTGVFAGVCTNDYATLYSRDLRLIDADYGTGNAPSIVANRLSYVLDLKGPSEAIDSACSSSLVALQHACQSLRNLECEMAIVGGVNAVLAPESNVYFSQVRALAKDGRCKAFDSRADGFVRSEGAGVVVLKRLSRALADGDRVYALVAGSAVNHDGRSNGILAPNGIAQQDVIRRALTAAGANVAEIDYVEAHGVGTPVADAVELRALGAVLADQPRESKLRVGSAKTNVGHLEAASGMVSLIKVALSMHHEEIPQQLHLQDPHPDIGLASLPIEIPTVPVAWRRGSRPRYAGVSTFGFGGTNAHVIVREAPLHARVTAVSDRPCHILPLSAKDETALRQLASRMAKRLAAAASRSETLGDIAFTASVGRSHLGHRLAVTGHDADEIRVQLESFARELPAPGVHSGVVKSGAQALIGLVFAEGGLRPGMLRELFQRHPPLRQAFEACEHWLRADLEQSPSALLCAEPNARAAELLERPSHAHAALVTMHYALYSLLRAWGIEPIAVYGAGAGEYSAAAATGVMSWQEAVTLAARRGRVLEGLVPGGEQTITVRSFKAELAAVDYLAPSVPFVSASIGRAFTLDEVPDDAHWAAHLYHEPRAGDGRDALLAEGCRLHVELGPAGALDARMHVAPEAWLTCVGDDAWRSLLGAVADLYVSGAAIDWHAFDAPYPRRKLSLPSYPFQRQRYWLDFPTQDREPAVRATNGQTHVIERPSSHPLISRVRVHVAPESGVAPKAAPIVPGTQGALAGGTSES